MSNVSHFGGALEVIKDRLGSKIAIRVEHSGYGKYSDLCIEGDGYLLSFTGQNYGIDKCTLLDNVIGFFNRIDESKK